MHIVFVISSYGFGHLTREIALKDALLKIQPDLYMTFVISEDQEKYFSKAILTTENIKIEIKPPTPQVANDNWQLIDAESSLEIYRRFWEWETQIRNDREWDRILYSADLIINDIESVHNPIAKKLGKKIVNISNFTWSDILKNLGDTELGMNYASWEKLADMHLKLAFSTDCLGFERSIDVGVLCRVIDWTWVDQMKQQFPEKKIMFTSTHQDYDFKFTQLIEFLDDNGFTIIIPERMKIETLHNQLLIPNSETEFQNYYALADLVVNKLGYGTVSETLTAGTPILYWKREKYAEDKILENAVLEHNMGVALDLSQSFQDLKTTIDKIIQEYDEKPVITNKTMEIAERIISLVYTS